MLTWNRVSAFVMGLAICAQFTGCTSSSKDDEHPAPAVVFQTPRVQGSFIQADLASSFNGVKWRTEYAAMNAAGVSELILQWTADSKGKTAQYPTTLPGYTGTSDMVSQALTNADAAGIDVYVGLQSNSDWWKGYSTDGAWLASEAALSNKLADDLWKQYKSHPSFKGWYLWFEVDNVAFPTSAEWDNLIAFYKTVGDHLHALTPGKKIVISPYFNASEDEGGLVSADWQDMWTYILASSPIDVIALQDGVGVGHATVDQLPEWFGATKRAVDSKTGCQLWGNAENFYIADNSPMAIQELVADMKAEAPFVTHFVSFSFNHYTSPQTANPVFYATYRTYALTGKVETKAPSTPTGLTAKAIDSSSIHLAWTASSDDTGIAGYTLYRDGTAVRSSSDKPAYDNYSLNQGTEYTYQVAAFDPAGNASALGPQIKITTPLDPVYPTNIAAGMPYTITPPPDATYPDDKGIQLTDGIYVDVTKYDFTDTGWVGSLESSYSIVVDLGKLQAIGEINSDWFQDEASWIFFPPSVAYSVSEDGTTYTSVGTVGSPTNWPENNKKYKVTNLMINGRYVKIDVTSNGWSFVDEVEVRN